jgi:glutamine synthetase type III
MSPYKSLSSDSDIAGGPVKPVDEISDLSEELAKATQALEAVFQKANNTSAQKNAQNCMSKHFLNMPVLFIDNQS